MLQSMNTALSSVTHGRPTRGLGRGVVAVLDMVALWTERRRQRRALEALPDHLLHDMGLSRADAEGEAEKPFWRG